MNIELRYLLGISAFVGSVLIVWWFASKSNKKAAAPTSVLALKGLIGKPASPVTLTMTMMNAVTMKHTMADARDCRIDWDVDFEKMEMIMHVGFISPALLLDFLSSRHHHDDRFKKADIVGPVEICKSFNVCIELPTGTRFKLRSYQSPIGKQPEIELFELEEKGAAR